MDDATILRIPKTGGPAEVVATDVMHGTRWVAVDATSIYWINQVTRKLRRRSKQGGDIETLRVSEDMTSLVLDGDDIYVNDKDGVRRLAK
jgi:hypothetical protein